MNLYIYQINDFAYWNKWLLQNVFIFVFLFSVYLLYFKFSDQKKKKDESQCANTHVASYILEGTSLSLTIVGWELMPVSTQISLYLCHAVYLNRQLPNCGTCPTNVGHVPQMWDVSHNCGMPENLSEMPIFLRKKIENVQICWGTIEICDKPTPFWDFGKRNSSTREQRYLSESASFAQVGHFRLLAFKWDTGKVTAVLNHHRMCYHQIIIQQNYMIVY